MSDDDALFKAVKGMVDEDDVSESESLPRIVVEEDRILVFSDDDWVEKEVGVEGDNLEASLGDDSGDSDEDGDDVERVEGGEVLEELVGGGGLNAGEERGGGKLYEVGAEGLYDSGKYDEGGGSEEDYEVLVGEIGVEGFVGVEEGHEGERSMLEVAGFVDEEAEKRRREKRSRGFG